jgi:multiple sugar transport system permease protein
LLDSEARTAYVLITPMVLVFIFVLAYPLGYAISLSFQKKALGLPGIFIAFENYRQLIVEDLVFPKLVRNTLLYVLTVVFFKSLIGLGMALVLNERLKGRSFFRGLLMMPWVTPQAVVAMNWKWILQVAGVLNFVLVGIGLAKVPIPWLAKPGLARFSVILINIWANFPFFGVNFLAAMQTIPSELYEAAEVDGASTLHRFIHVTWPGIRQSYLVLVILSTIWTWNAFTHIWLLTGGGPVNSTHVFATYSYQAGLSNYRLGYAAAISLIFLPVLVLMVNVVSPLLLRSREEQIW